MLGIYIYMLVAKNWISMGFSGSKNNGFTNRSRNIAKIQELKSLRTANKH